MRANWVDFTDYRDQTKDKQRSVHWTAMIGPLFISISRERDDFPNEWAYELAPLFGWVGLRLPAWAEVDAAQERALARARLVIEPAPGCGRFLRGMPAPCVA